MTSKKEAPAIPGSTASAHNADPTTSRRAIVAEPAKDWKRAIAGPQAGQHQITTTGTQPKLSPRQARVLDALRPGHWVDREPLDRIAGSSNSPDVIWKLRHKFGQDAIDMELIDGIDRDGKPCRTGRYRLTEQGCDRLIQLGISTGTEGRAT